MYDKQTGREFSRQKGIVFFIVCVIFTEFYIFKIQLLLKRRIIGGNTAFPLDAKTLKGVLRRKLIVECAASWTCFLVHDRCGSETLGIGSEKRRGYQVYEFTRKQNIGRTRECNFLSLINSV